MGCLFLNISSHIHLSQWRTWRGTTAAQNDLIWCLRTFSMFWARRTRPTSPHWWSVRVKYMGLSRAWDRGAWSHFHCSMYHALENQTIMLIMKRIKVIVLSISAIWFKMWKLYFRMRSNYTSAFFSQRF